MRTQIGDMRTEMNEMRDDLANRIDGNTIVLNRFAGLVHDHDWRIAKLKAKP